MEGYGEDKLIHNYLLRSVKKCDRIVVGLGEMTQVSNRFDSAARCAYGVVGVQCLAH